MAVGCEEGAHAYTSTIIFSNTTTVSRILRFYISTLFVFVSLLFRWRARHARTSTHPERGA